MGWRLLDATEGEPRWVQITLSASYHCDPRGQFVVEQTCIQHYNPGRRRDSRPSFWSMAAPRNRRPMATRAGRTSCSTQAYDVHVVDLVERSRSGFHPGLWPGEPIVRSATESWRLFRIGEASV